MFLDVSMVKTANINIQDKGIAMIVDLHCVPKGYNEKMNYPCIDSVQLRLRTCKRAILRMAKVDLQRSSHQALTS